MKKNILFMMSCDKANLVSEKIQYNEASLSEKLKYKLHLFICSICKLYAIKNAKLTELLNKTKSKILTPTEKEELQSTFNKKLNNHQ